MNQLWFKIVFIKQTAFFYFIVIKWLLDALSLSRSVNGVCFFSQIHIFHHLSVRKNIKTQ